jgi:phosphoenolpyruvate synthase/pyruvate phosphate dikinase
MIVGLPASPGRCIGRARVLTGLDQLGSLKAGEILVARFAVPEIVTAFGLISAFVTDHGGRFAHAAVVAREAGVPGVVGTLNATEQIRTGTLLIVDGAEGTVEVAE